MQLLVVMGLPRGRLATQHSFQDVGSVGSWPLIIVGPHVCVIFLSSLVAMVFKFFCIECDDKDVWGLHKTIKRNH